MTSREAFTHHYTAQEVFIPGVDGSAWETWQAAIEWARKQAEEACDKISKEEWRQYKGHGENLDPAKRANSHTEGVSDGADICSAAINEALS